VSTAEFLAHLRRLDVRLWADGERLRTSAPVGVLTPALRAELATHKTAILAFLRTAAGAAPAAFQQQHPFPWCHRRCRSRERYRRDTRPTIYLK
jgi:TubC N-terminal docking domain